MYNQQFMQLMFSRSYSINHMPFSFQMYTLIMPSSHNPSRKAFGLDKQATH